MFEKIHNKFQKIILKLKNIVNITLFGIEVAFSAAKAETILNILLFTLEQFPAIITAFALRMIIDACTNGDGNIYFYAAIWVLCYLAALLISKIINSISGILTVSLRKKFELYFDKKIIDRVLDSGLAFFDEPSNIDTLRIVQNESGVINSIIFVGLRIFSAFLALCTSIALLSVLSPWMTVIYIIAVIPAVIANSKFNFLLWEYDFTHSRDYRRSDNVYSEITDQSKAIEFRLYNNFHVFKNEYFQLWNSWSSEKSKLFKKHSLKLFAAYLLQFAAMLGVFVLSIIRFLASAITVGDVQFYVNTALSVGDSVMAFFDNITSIAIYGDKVGKLKNFLKAEKYLTDKSGMLDMPDDFVIEFDNVGFKYPNSEEWILKNCSFSIVRGDKAALVGLNGAGKSTVIKLILGFYQVSEGRILINKIPIEEYSKDSLNQRFSAMFQDIVIYSMSIRDNITIGSKCKDDEGLLEKACDFAGITSMISELPEKYDTELQRTFDEKGFVPSGGQAQRIALARAFYRSGEIMILDEPVASIDPETEFEIFDKVGRMCSDKTLILVSHRLSNVMKCNKIIVIKNGCVSEMGSHNELIAKNGEYAHMFLMQAAKYNI